MLTRNDLGTLILEALTELKGSGKVVDIAKTIWGQHEESLRRSGDLFYSWQYDMRWAALKLRKEGKLRVSDKRGIWELPSN